MSYAILLLLALPFAAEHPTETDADRKPRLQVDGNALIRGATIHTAVGPAFEGDVLVQDGRIAAVGRVTAPAGVTVIEAKGMHLAPGSSIATRTSRSTAA